LKYAKELLESGDFFSARSMQAIPMVKFAFICLFQALSDGCDRIELLMKAAPGRSWRIRYHLPDGSLKREETGWDQEAIVEVARVFYNVGEPVDRDPEKARKAGKITRKAVTIYQGDRVELNVDWHAISEADEKRWMDALGRELEQASKNPSLPIHVEDAEERLEVGLRRFPK